MFPCTGCGLCCQNITDVVELKEYDLGNGTCKYFDAISGDCQIYETRPDICRIDKMFDIAYHKKYTKDEFYKLNADACNTMQGKYKIDASFKIILGE